MRRWRRRKPRVQWLPNNIGNNNLDADRVALLGSFAEEPAVIESLLIGSFRVPETTSFAVFLDAAPEEAQTGATAATIAKQGLQLSQAWGYRLRRIVGKLQLVAFANGQGPSWTALHVKLALMVRRVDPDTGAALAAGNNSDTMAYQNVQDPWIWQRNFYLSTNTLNPADTTQLGAALGLLSPITFECGGTKDGPAFDIKTARRLGPEERTFLDVTIVGLPLGDSGTLVADNNAGVYIHVDYRALATIAPAAGNRRNASR